MVSETPHLREKTARLGAIARILAVFRVEYLTIYIDNPQTSPRETELVSTLLEYAATPQYLRRALFPLNPTLQFAGIIPPLRTPNHQLNSRTEDLPPESYREGVVIAASPEECSVDVGLPKPLNIKHLGAKPGQRVVLRVRRDHTTLGQIVPDDQIPHYFGLRTISHSESLKQALEGDYDLRIATSRLGKPINQLSEKLTKAINTSKKALILFGPPSEGLNQIAAREGFTLDEKVDFTLNTVPDQGTATVRTEEALSATLALINYFTHPP